MSDEDSVSDVLDLDVSAPGDERRWVVLYDEDYDDMMIDRDDNLAILVDIEQSSELLRLACESIAEISECDGDPLNNLIGTIETEESDD